jgi:hypothetical protein
LLSTERDRQETRPLRGPADDAIGEFAMEYANQNERDYRGLVTAVKEGRIEATADI